MALTKGVQCFCKRGIADVPIYNQDGKPWWMCEACAIEVIESYMARKAKGD